MDLEEQKNIMRSIGPFHSIRVTFVNGNVYVGRFFTSRRDKWTAEYQSWVDATGSLHQLEDSDGDECWEKGILPSPDVLDISVYVAPQPNHVESQASEATSTSTDSASSEGTSSETASSESTSSATPSRGTATTEPIEASRCVVCDRLGGRTSLVCTNRSCGVSVHVRCARTLSGGAVKRDEFLCPTCLPHRPQPVVCAVCNATGARNPYVCLSCGACVHVRCALAYHTRMPARAEFLCPSCFPAPVCVECESFVWNDQRTTCESCGEVYHIECLGANCSVCTTSITKCVACKKTPVNDIPLRCVDCGLGYCEDCFVGLERRCHSCYRRTLYLPPIHDLGPSTTCNCGAFIFANNRTTSCCSSGKHILPASATEIPPILHDFISRHYALLISNAREINQLASVTSVGVEGLRQYGGVQEQHGGSCFTSIQGRCYHHDMYEPSNRRAHPLLGNGLSYVFLETTWQNSPASERFSSEVINAALELRQTLRRFNPVVRSIIRDEQLHQRAVELIRTGIPEAEVRIEDDGLNVSATASSQLMLLFSVHGSLTQVPNTTRDVIRPGIAPLKVRHESADYERTAYPLIDIYAEDGWYRRDHDGDSYKDSEGNVLTLRKYLRFKFCQSQVLRMVPRLAQEWLLDMVSRSEYLNQKEQIHIIDGYRRSTVSEVVRSQNPITAGKACTLPSSIVEQYLCRTVVERLCFAIVLRYL